MGSRQTDYRPEITTHQDSTNSASSNLSEQTSRGPCDRIPISTPDSAAQTHLPVLQITEPGSTVKETIAVDGKNREFFLHVPKQYDGKEEVPLVLVYNGYSKEKSPTAGAAGMEARTGFSQKADSENFIVAYMDGNAKQAHCWNNKEWFFSKLDDTKFTKKVMDDISHDYKVDPSKVYLVGFSQGASFVHRAANEMPDRVAAIADVSGWMTGKENATPKDMSVLSIHSADDKTVPATGKKIWVQMNSQWDTAKFYRQVNGIESAPDVEKHRAPDGTVVVDSTSTNAKTGAQVETIVIQKQPHIWFGEPGKPDAPVNATDLVWDFLKKHPKPMAVPADASRVRAAGGGGTAKLDGCFEENPGQ